MLFFGTTEIQLMMFVFLQLAVVVVLVMGAVAVADLDAEETVVLPNYHHRPHRPYGAPGSYGGGAYGGNRFPYGVTVPY